MERLMFDNGAHKFHVRRWNRRNKVTFDPECKMGCVHFHRYSLNGLHVYDTENITDVKASNGIDDSYDTDHWDQQTAHYFMGIIGFHPKL